MTSADLPSSAAVICKCGELPSATTPGRCRLGHLITGNENAMLTGEQSKKFWKEHDALKKDIALAIIQDQGFTEADVPRALALAASGIAQATIVRDSAYRGMLELGGPLTDGDRPRRAFHICWLPTSASRTT